MNPITKALLSRGINREKQNIKWNMIGSFCYAFASIVLSFIVVRIVGEDQGGAFTFGFSTFGQQMFTVAYFGIRPFQVTDTASEYTFQEYFCHRVITCGAAVLIGAGYLGFLYLQGIYTPAKALVIFLLVLYKVIDGFADVYESEFQRNGNLYLTGKSNTFRTILSVAALLLTLMMTKQLLVACAAAVAAQILGVIVFDIVVIRCLEGIDYHQGQGKTRALFRSTSLLFLSVFLDFYIFSSAKYAIDLEMGNAYSGYFNFIFMPTSVINLVAGFVIRPFLTSLTEFWNKSRFEDFKRQIFQIACVIMGLTVLAVGGTWLLGKPVLGILEAVAGSDYHGKLVRYHGSFLIIVLGGGFYAVLNLMYYALVIMRKQSQIFTVYALITGVAFVLSLTLVRAFGIWGAALAYLSVMVLLSAGFGLLAFQTYQRGKQDYEKLQ